MSEPDRDKLTQALFQAARDERASDEVKARVLDELLETPPPSSGTGAVATRKWMAWAGLALLATVGLVAVTQDPSASSVEPPSVTGQPGGTTSSPVGEAPTPAAALLAAPPTPEVERPQTPASAPTTPPPSETVPSVTPTASDAPRPTPRRPPADDTDRLAKEVRLVDEARRRLASSPAEALRVLDAYTREFGAGALHKEAALVRVEALVKAGRPDEARRLAKKLVASEPAGPIAARVRELLGEAQP